MRYWQKNLDTIACAKRLDLQHAEKIFFEVGCMGIVAGAACTGAYPNYSLRPHNADWQRTTPVCAAVALAG